MKKKRNFPEFYEKTMPLFFALIGIALITLLVIVFVVLLGS